MKIYFELLKKIKKKYKSIPKFAKELKMSKQLLYYHLSNLKNDKISFKSEKLKEISEKLDIEINFFYK